MTPVHAGNATITNTFAHLTFFNPPRPATPPSPTTAATVVFLNNSTGGNAAITNNFGGLVDFSGAPALRATLMGSPSARSRVAGAFCVGCQRADRRRQQLVHRRQRRHRGSWSAARWSRSRTGTLTLSDRHLHRRDHCQREYFRAGAVNRFSTTSAFTIDIGGTLDLNGFNHTFALNRGSEFVLLGASSHHQQQRPVHRG